jgi:hypothetical protein
MTWKAQAKHRAERTEILLALGGGKIPMCVRCGITHRRVLTGDHIKGDGFKLRKANKRSADGSGWPRHAALLEAARNGTMLKIYQCLCQNCNIIKKFDNGENTPGCLRSNGHRDAPDPQLEFFSGVLWQNRS